MVVLQYAVWKYCSTQECKVYGSTAVHRNAKCMEALQCTGTQSVWRHCSVQEHKAYGGTAVYRNAKCMEALQCTGMQSVWRHCSTHKQKWNWELCIRKIYQETLDNEKDIHDVRCMLWNLKRKRQWHNEGTNEPSPMRDTISIFLGKMIMKILGMLNYIFYYICTEITKLNTITM